MKELVEIIAKSIRTVVRAAALKGDKKVVVDIK